MLLFKEIILQQFDAFKIEIQCTLTKLRALKASRGHPSKVVKLPIMSPEAEDMEYLNNWCLRHELPLVCVINGHIWLSCTYSITGLIKLYLSTEFVSL